MSLLCRASGLVINPLKSSLHYFGLEDYELDIYKAIFPFKFVDLDIDFHYLGFYLKLANYHVEDWRWILQKNERRIELWCHSWLSLGGRYVLVKVVLESLSVF